MLSDSVKESSGDSDLQEGFEKVAMVHLASEPSSVVGLEAVEGVKNAARTADLVTVPCVFVGCGENMKGRLQQPLGVVSRGSRRSQLTVIAGFNTWWHYAQTGLTSSDLVSFPCWWLIPRGKRAPLFKKAWGQASSKETRERCNHEVKAVNEWETNCCQQYPLLAYEFIKEWVE